MAPVRAFSTVRLVNGSIGDPVLYLDYPGSNNALLFDGGDNARLTMSELADLEAMFITHHHVDHFIGLDRVIRANIDQDKTLHIFGPIGTIQKISDRVRSYEYPFFPFQKIVLEIHELLPGVIRTGILNCTKHFPPPDIHERPWVGRVCYENASLAVEAVHADHTVPCLAFAMAEKRGYHPDPERLTQGLLRPGNWIGEVLRLLRSGAAEDTILHIQGGQFTLRSLADAYCVESPGARVAYITDTFWSEDVRPQLVQLAKGAWRLYCDSFYAAAQSREAAKHRHMQAPQTAELAKLAKVEQLVLIHFSTRYQGQYHKLIREAAAVFPRVTAEIDES